MQMFPCYKLNCARSLFEISGKSLEEAHMVIYQYLVPTMDVFPVLALINKRDIKLIFYPVAPLPVVFPIVYSITLCLFCDSA